MAERNGPTNSVNNDADYAESGMDIQAAFLDRHRSGTGDRSHPLSIVWEGQRVFTAFWMEAPVDGTVEAEFLSVQGGAAQGFDLKASGWIKLPGGERVRLLRTWKDDRLDDFVRYRYHSPDRRLLFNNVFKRDRGRQGLVDEKWTGNAGMVVEQLGPETWVFHCSPGTVAQPDFQSMLVRVSIAPLQG